MVWNANSNLIFKDASQSRCSGCPYQIYWTRRGLRQSLRLPNISRQILILTSHWWSSKIQALHVSTNQCWVDITKSYTAHWSLPWLTCKALCSHVFISSIQIKFILVYYWWWISMLPCCRAVSSHGFWCLPHRHGNLCRYVKIWSDHLQIIGWTLALLDLIWETN